MIFSYNVIVNGESRELGSDFLSPGIMSRTEQMVAYADNILAWYDLMVGTNAGDTVEVHVTSELGEYVYTDGVVRVVDDEQDNKKHG